MLFNPFPESTRHIAVIAPSGPADFDDIKTNCSLVNSFGIKTTIMPNVGASNSSSYLSARVEDRLDDLHSCWKDKSIDLIIAARGGFGSAHLLPHIDWSLLAEKGIPLIGFSDLSAIHLAMLSKGVGVPVAGWHIARFRELLENEYSAKSLKEALSVDKKVSIILPEGNPISFIKGDSLSGPVVPVNLAVFVTLIGTEYMPDLAGKILLVEDINEPLYKLDRYFTQIEQSGILERLSGLVYGNFSKCGNIKARNLLFNKIAEKVDGPVAKGFPFGHKLPMCSLKYNSVITL